MADRQKILSQIGAVSLALIVLMQNDLCAQTPAEIARAYRESNAARILVDYAELRKSPNVADDSVNIRRNAAYISDQFVRRGAEMEIVELPGAPPLVIGKLNSRGATRTIGIYAHYDGQPVDPDRWRQSPWEPTIYTQDIDAGGGPRPR